MPIITTRFYWIDDHIKRWEALEAKGNLGSTNTRRLEQWRRLLVIAPKMIAMSECQGQYRVYKELR